MYTRISFILYIFHIRYSPVYLLIIFVCYNYCMCAHTWPLKLVLILIWVIVYMFGLEGSRVQPEVVWFIQSFKKLYLKVMVSSKLMAWLKCSKNIIHIKNWIWCVHRSRAWPLSWHPSVTASPEQSAPGTMWILFHNVKVDLNNTHLPSLVHIISMYTYFSTFGSITVISIRLAELKNEKKC